MATVTSGQQDLSSLIMRATNPLNQEDDPNLIQAVCQEIGNDAGKIQLAVRLIVHKMQSPHEREAMQALLVLQACINNCGSNFHSEVGKFRFLNEMIKLVSPKYFGNQTPFEVKKKVIELLYTWTLDLKSEPKICEAYDMLKKQGVVKEDPNYLGSHVQPAPKDQKVVSIEDEKKSRMLQRLLQSTKSEDIIKANALIKHMVKEDERRMERSSRRIVEVETALNNVSVLDEMLTQHKESDLTKQADLDLMEELFSSCQTLRANIYRIVSEMEDKEDGMGDLLKASDELSRVMGRYKLEMECKSESSKDPAEMKTSKKVEEDSLLDLSSAVSPHELEKSNVDDLGLGNLDLSSCGAPELKEEVLPSSSTKAKKDSILDELGDVFSNGTVMGAPNLPGNALGHEALLQPLSPLKNNSLVGLLPAPDSSLLDKESPKALNDLDLLGSSLLRDSLPTHVDPIGSHFRAQEKVSLNEMKQKSLSVETVSKKASPPSLSVLASTQGKALKDTNSEKSNKDLDIFGNLVQVESNDSVPRKEWDTPVEPQDSSCLLSLTSSSTPDSKLSPDLSSSLLNTKIANSSPSSLEPKTIPNVQLGGVKPLANIHVALEDIKPGNQSPVPLIESNGVSLVLHFADNKPRDDVSILVVSVTSRNAKAISNYVLQAVGPKGCKVRLQPPSSTSLAEYSPFLPPPAVTQIMLIANPNQLNVSLKVMLSYSIDDDPVTDMGEIDKLPL